MTESTSTFLTPKIYSSTVINKGQVLTHYYRLMNKKGGYTWIQTCATVVCNSKNNDEQNIICVNYVVSNRENENLILDCIQMENGLENLIKHEEVGDKGAGSPGNDPSSDGGPGHGNPNDTLKSPKSNTPEPRSRARNHTSGSTVGNTANASLTVDGGIVSGMTDDCVMPTPTSRKGHKRKAKQESDSLGNECEPKVLGMDVMGTTNHHESSVKDLENAMSKHLPSPINNNTNNNNTTTTDFSADSLLKQDQDKSSTIQWIGAHHHSPYHQQSAPMPATALLRQLYANRESVIRATARQSTGGVFYPDGSSTGPLPTPPGSESSFDNQFLLHGHPQKSDAFTNLVSTYGGYPATMDYHNAMTPPSSVSPREPSANGSNNNKSTVTSIHPASNGYEFPDPLRSQYGTGMTGNESIPPLPLKPQPYSAAAMHHAANANPIDAYGTLDQSQYFPHHAGFHLYHKNTPATGWYSTPT